MTDGAVALVVDDSSVNRMLLSRHLGALGIEAREAEDGKSALAALREFGGDVAVVLLDVMMPEMDGYETLATIKSDETLRHLPVIMISAVDELDSVARCLEMGAADYLPKPFDPVILAARVRASLADKRLHDAEVAHAEAQALLLETIERQKQELRASSPRRSRRSCPARRASRCSPGIAARPRPSSAICAASPTSATRPSRRRC